MSEIIGYKIQQIVDNGHAVQITLAEDVQTEPVSQKQLIMAVSYTHLTLPTNREV